MTVRTSPDVANPLPDNMNANPGRTAPEALPPLLLSFHRHIKAAGKAPATIDHYVGASLQFLDFAAAQGFPDIEHIAREHIELWLISLQETLAPASVRNRFVGLRVWLRWLVAEDEIPRDPTVRMAMPQVAETSKDIAPEALVAKTLQMLEKAGNRRDAVIVAILYDTGMRSTELADLLLEDIDIDAGLVRLRRTKNRTQRLVHLGGNAIRLLDRYLRRRDLSRDAAPLYLLSGPRGKMTRAGIYDAVRDAFDAAGSVRVISPHDLRHTSASAAADRLSESDLMALYGWRSSDMARHYTRQAREKLAVEAHKLASPLDRLNLR